MRPLLSAVLIMMAGLGTGCASTSYPTPVFHTPYFASRDSVFQYRLPAGWFDATADSQASGHAVWLLRNDYTASIAVTEVHLDPDAREDLRAGGIMHLATLSMALAAGGKPYVLQQSPEAIKINGRPSCIYQLMASPANDILRVVLMDAGERVYMTTALVSGETKRGVRSEVFAVEDAFLGSLRW